MDEKSAALASPTAPPGRSGRGAALGASAGPSLAGAPLDRKVPLGPATAAAAGLAPERKAVAPARPGKATPALASQQAFAAPYPLVQNAWMPAVPSKSFGSLGMSVSPMMPYPMPLWPVSNTLPVSRPGADGLMPAAPVAAMAPMTALPLRNVMAMSKAGQPGKGKRKRPASTATPGTLPTTPTLPVMTPLAGLPLRGNAMPIPSGPVTSKGKRKRLATSSPAASRRVVCVASE
eukprot:scaffold1387_cov260-Pinguiococcus_pyrenoidosus.AAC.23